MRLIQKDPDCVHPKKIKLKDHDCEYDDCEYDIETGLPQGDQTINIERQAFKILAFRILMNKWINISGYSTFLNWLTPSLFGVTLGIGQILGFTSKASTDQPTISRPNIDNTDGADNTCPSLDLKDKSLRDTRTEEETERSVEATKCRARNHNFAELIQDSNECDRNYHHNHASGNNVIKGIYKRQLYEMESTATPPIHDEDGNIGIILDDGESIHEQPERTGSKDQWLADAHKASADKQIRNVDASRTMMDGRVDHMKSTRSYDDYVDKRFWMEINASLFNIRSQKYMRNRLKMPSNPNLLRLMAVDFVEAPEPIMTGFCSHPKERVQKWLAIEKTSSNQDKIPNEIQDDSHVMPEFVFCVNVVLPGPPTYHFVIYFAVDDCASLGIRGKGSKNDTKPHSALLDDFFFGPSDEFRNEVFKVLPRIVEGNVFLKAAVGNNPMLIGKRLKPTYIQTDNFLEMIIDVSSHAMTDRLVKSAQKNTSQIIAEFGFVLEGKTESTLPENILGSVRLQSSKFDGNLRFVDIA